MTAFTEALKERTRERVPLDWAALPWMIPDRSSPSRVRFAASRPGLLRADLEGGAVTRRAVAQRRSRASGLTCLSA